MQNKAFLGIDTSNYTTSAAVFFPKENRVFHERKLLPVKTGLLGLRQSDAVFEHVRALPDVLGTVLQNLGGESPAAVGASVRPRDVEGSYMPCFLVGETVARALSESHHVPLYRFSHQAGHVAAALFSAGSFALLEKEFFAFHVSGGTTELLFVKPDKEHIFKMEIIGKTLDINAGQLIDRVGKLLHIPFPAGPALERLAMDSKEDYFAAQSTKPSVKNGDISLSGFENKCKKLLDVGFLSEDIARFCLDAVARSLVSMTQAAIDKYGLHEILFSGGVLSNKIIGDHLRTALSDRTLLHFSEPSFSSDNAAGIAILTGLREERIL